MNKKSDMNLIFEGWRGFLTEQNAQASLGRVEKIAELRGIEGGSYHYENGELNGIKLTKEEIKYIEQGGSLPIGTGDGQGAKSLSADAAKVMKIAKEKKSFKHYVMGISLHIFVILDPGRKNPPQINTLRNRVVQALRSGKVGVKKSVKQKIISLLDESIKNRLELGNARKIASLLGLEY